MKKLILAMALVMTTLSIAQDRKQVREKLTAEQQSELHAKKMKLDLDLDDKQQKEVKAILLEQAKKREAKMEEMKAKREKGEKPSAEERYNMKNEMLDHQIEMKAKMKKILKPEQYKKWEENHDEKITEVKEKMQRRIRERKAN